LHPQTSLEDPDSLGRQRYRLARGNFQWFVGHYAHKQASVTRLRPEGGVIDWPAEIFNGLLEIISQNKLKSPAPTFHSFGSTAWNYYVLISYFDACENQLQYGLTVYGSQNTVRLQSETDIEGGTAWKRKF
jgi:hypothetical protein